MTKEFGNGTEWRVKEKKTGGVKRNQIQNKKDERTAATKMRKKQREIEDRGVSGGPGRRGPGVMSAY